jgi:hypothetical protein
LPGLILVLVPAPGLGKAVVGIRPDGCLARIFAGRADAGSQQRQPGSAALAHRRERHPVPGELQGDLVRFPHPVPARYRDDAEDRTINAEYLPHN